jgi:hypothetical protein
MKAGRGAKNNGSRVQGAGGREKIVSGLRWTVSGIIRVWVILLF